MRCPISSTHIRSRATAAPRRGFGLALMIVLAIVLVIGTFGGLTILLSHASSRQLDLISSRLRAIAVAEAGFAEIVSRLSSTPWSQRWFAGHPSVDFDVPAAGGKYEYFLRDSPAPSASSDLLTELGLLGSNQVDLLIRATYEDTKVTVFWRLTLREDSTDAHRRVVPSFFTFGTEGSRADARSADALGALVNEMATQRSANRARFESLQGPLASAAAAAQIASALGVEPPGPIVDETGFGSGGSDRSNPPYVLRVRRAIPRGQQWLPPPPPGSTATGGGSPGSGTPGGGPPVDVSVATVARASATLAYLRSRLERIRCYFGSSAYPEEPWLAPMAGDYLVEVASMESALASLAARTDPAPTQEEIDATLSSFEASVQGCMSTIELATDMVGHDPIGCSCP